MSSDVEIRQGALSDADTLVAFNTEMARETEGKELAHEVISAGVRRLLEDDADGFYLIAEMDGGIVGSLMVTTEWSDWRNGFFWWIQSVYVVPAERRNGVYGRLYARVKSMAALRDDVFGFRLYVDKSNAGARRAYEALGMRETAYRLYEEEL